MEIRRCKKCGCTLPSNSQYKLCASCRLRKKEKIKKGLAIVGGIFIAILTLGGSVVATILKAKNKH